MIITKTTTKKYEIKFIPSVWNMSHGEFIAARKRYGMKTAKHERCFICGHRFKYEDIPILIQVSGIGNRFACAQCAGKEGLQC